MDAGIGVLNTLDGRSLKDQQLQSDFSCKKAGFLPNIKQFSSNDGIGVLGSDYEMRSIKDLEMMATFRCSRENFTQQPEMIYPRSVKDQAMLRQFNACPCKENFTSQAQKIARMKFEKNM